MRNIILGQEEAISILIRARCDSQGAIYGKLVRATDYLKAELKATMDAYFADTDACEDCGKGGANHVEVSGVPYIVCLECYEKLLANADVECCDECGVDVPADADGVTGDWHEESCSAYEGETETERQLGISAREIYR